MRTIYYLRLHQPHLGLMKCMPNLVSHWGNFSVSICSKGQTKHLHKGFFGTSKIFNSYLYLRGYKIKIVQILNFNKNDSSISHHSVKHFPKLYQQLILLKLANSDLQWAILCMGYENTEVSKLYSLHTSHININIVITIWKANKPPLWNLTLTLQSCATKPIH